MVVPDFYDARTGEAPTAAGIEVPPRQQVPIDVHSTHLARPKGAFGPIRFPADEERYRSAAPAD